MEQIAHLIAMVANTGMLRWDDPRTADEWLPYGWQNRYDAEDSVPVLTFDEQLDLAMERASMYQAGQAANGIQ